MQQVNDALNSLLAGYFKDYRLTPIQAGATKAQLFKITLPNNKPLILKSQPSGLLNDYLNYTWLAGKVPVPKVIFHECLSGYEYLCVTALAGKPLEEYVGEISNKEIVKRYAQALRQLHALALDEKAIVQNLDDRLWQAHHHLQNGLVDTQQFQPEYQPYSLEELYQKLLASKPQSFEGVFTHGDYCLDNLLFDDAAFSGFVDLDKGGIADRYQDIALAVRNIKNELGESLLPLFFTEYGLENINQNKIDFYILLDEFF